MVETTSRMASSSSTTRIFSVVSVCTWHNSRSHYTRGHTPPGVPLLIQKTACELHKSPASWCLASYWCFVAARVRWNIACPTWEAALRARKPGPICRSEEHTSELQSHSFISYAVFC